MQRASRSIAMTLRAPSARRARVNPPGPGPISTIAAFPSGPAALAIRRVRLRSKMKFCPRDFFAQSPQAVTTDRNGGKPSKVFPPAGRRRDSGMPYLSPPLLPDRQERVAACEPARKLKGGNEARRIRDTLASKADGRAMIGRCPHKRQA